MFDSIRATLKDLLFPKQCLVCFTIGFYLCDSCADHLETALQRCIVCTKSSLGGWTHPKCLSKNKPERLISIFNYHNQLLAKMINTAKIALVPEVFSDICGQAIKRLEVNSSIQNFVLCPIPQLTFKERWRGFNQSSVIAECFGKQYHLAIDKILLKKISTKDQKQLNKQERLTNLKGTFSVNSPEYLPKEVILIDDITTTGATFLESAKQLKKAGVKTVWCLALASD